MLFLILIIIVFVVPLVASAIEFPFGGMKEGDNPEPGVYIKALYIWGLGIAGALAVAAIAFGGFLYMVGKTAQAKDYILSALLGLLLLFGAYIILWTINHQLIDLSGPDLAPIEKYVPAPTPTPPPPPPPPSGGMTEQAARDLLTAHGIGVKPACAQGQSVGCVKLEGIKQTTLNEVISLVEDHNISPNSVYITGGTEAGHSEGQYSHENGYKVDLMMSDILTSYIEDNFTKIEPPTFGSEQYRSPSGAIYTNESNHWDVSVVMSA